MFYSSLSGMGVASTKGQATSALTEARFDASEAKSEADLLKNDIDRLLMLTEALWTFLKKEHGYSDEQLADAVKTIDLRDGRLDGKVAKIPPAPCPKCGRLNSSKQSLCIYCGSPLPTA